MSDNGCIYTPPEGTPNIGKVYGLDIENELTNVLVDELSNTIDKQIMDSITGMEYERIMKEKLNDLLKKHLRDKKIDDIING